MTQTFHISVMLKVERQWSCTSTIRPRLVVGYNSGLMRGLRVSASVFRTVRWHCRQCDEHHRAF
jgi:hypothetical protein